MTRYLLRNDDCLEVMKEIKEKSIHAIITDLPYGTTLCKWDAIIPLMDMWRESERILKSNGVFITTAVQPFTSSLIMSNLSWFKYECIWKKNKSNNFVQAKNMPLLFHENILIFSPGGVGHATQLGDRRMTYNPQGLIPCHKKWSRPKRYDSEHRLTRKSHLLDRTIDFENYPSTLIDIGNSNNRERGLHPTQKPIALYEYLIKTYTNENDWVADICMGSGTTGVAALNLNRRFIGIEKEKNYFEIAQRRIEELLDIS